MQLCRFFLPLPNSSTVELFCLPGVWISSRHPLKKQHWKKQAKGKKTVTSKEKGGDRRKKEQSGEKRMNM